MILELKVTIVATIVTIAAALSWVAQAVPDGDSTTVTTIIPAAALTGTSAALVWVVKQVVSGNLVHRDPARDNERLAAALEASTKAMVEAGRREDSLFRAVYGGADESKS